MRQLSLRTAVVAMTAGLVLPLLPVTSVAAAPTAERADRAAAWQATQLTDGRIHNIAFDVTDWGLTVDTYFALVAADNRRKVARTVLSTVSANAREYVAFQGDYFAGPVAKLLLAREVGGRDATVGRLDLRARLTRMIAPSGRVQDSGSDDFSNTISQSFAVLALARTGRLRPSTADFLTRQQCDPGFFRLAMSARQCGGGSGKADVDATAFALQALVRARNEGVDLPAGAIRDTARWLTRAQARNGSFSGQGLTAGANSNSTGLAAQALALVGRDAAARKAAGWVAGLQLTRRNAGDTPARRDLGAIAYNRADFRRARQEGIDATTRDTWRRSTPQALFAFARVPLSRLSVS